MKHTFRKLAGPRRTVQAPTLGSYSQNPPYKGEKHIAKMRSKGANKP
jgi:hypothetical protein